MDDYTLEDIMDDEEYRILYAAERRRNNNDQFMSNFERSFTSTFFWMFVIGLIVAVLFLGSGD